jgi:DNA invertase Pin-like site-specific DNA recombinase
MGEAFFTMAGIFAEMERNYISERTRAAIARKKEMGIHCGRPSVYDPEKFELYRHMLEDKGMHHARAEKLAGFSQSSYRRYKARLASGELTG